MSENELVFCNSCGSKVSSVLVKNVFSRKGGIFNVEKCTRCGLAYLNPRPTNRKIYKYYSQKTYWGGDVKHEKSYSYLLHILLSRIRKGRILDIGAGTGLFLSIFKKDNWEISGVEFSKIAVDIARKHNGIILQKGDFLEKKFPANYFDVISLNNSLEHLYKPKETLLGVHRVIKKGGIVLITVPNLESIGFKFFRKNWYGIDAPRHLYHFTPATLSKMVSDCGLKVMQVKHGYWQHNFPILFESFRRYSSPRIKIEGSANYEQKSRFLEKNSIYQLIKNIVVVLSKVFFGIIAFLEPIFRKGEVFVMEVTK